MEKCIIPQIINEIFKKKKTHQQQQPNSTTTLSPWGNFLKNYSNPCFKLVICISWVLQTENEFIFPVFILKLILTCVRNKSPVGRLGYRILEEGKFQTLAGHSVTYAWLTVAGLLAFHPEGAIGAVWGQREGLEREPLFGYKPAVSQPLCARPPDSEKTSRILTIR